MLAKAVTDLLVVDPLHLVGGKIGALDFNFRVVVVRDLLLTVTSARPEIRIVKIVAHSPVEMLDEVLTGFVQTL